MNSHLVTSHFSVKYSGQVATVFGSTSFIGRYVINRFARIGANVIAPFRGEEKSINHLKVIGEIGQVVPVPLNIRHKESIENAVKHATIVVNILGKYTNTKSFTLEESNVQSARDIAIAAKNAGVERFIHISAVGASENASSEFLRSKAKSEKVVREIFPSATILRCTVPFGYGDKFLNKYGNLARYSPVFLLPLAGSALIQPVYVRDIATAVMAVVAQSEDKGDTYELGGPEIFTFREFIEYLILELIKKQNRLIFELPRPFNQILAGLSEQTRRATWTKDEIKMYGHDTLVTNPDALSFEDLNITPTTIHDTAITILRGFRKPIYYEE